MGADESRGALPAGEAEVEDSPTDAEQRADERLKVIPVGILSSSKKERDIAESRRLGANGYVRKPVEFRGFSDAVEKLGLR